MKAITSGEVDGGWPSTRAFANAGITGLETVEAPMTLTSYAAEKALVSGPVADKLLAELDGTGVVGLRPRGGPTTPPVCSGGTPARAGELGRCDVPGLQLTGANRRCAPPRRNAGKPGPRMDRRGAGRTPARRGVRHRAVRGDGKHH